MAALGVVALASLPYLVVYLTTPADLRFVGVLINPFDGNSYLAKMQIGAQGDWLFHLTYTAEDHPGAPVYLFYLWLGHVAAWTRLPIPLVYHLTRVIAGMILLAAVYALIAHVTSDLSERRTAFLFVALSSGLGWLAAALGHQGTSDLFIPESNTFFSLHLNPHFPSATVFMVAMFVLSISRPSWPRRLLMIVASLMLAVIQPFAVAPVYGALGVFLMARWRRDGRPTWPFVWTVWIAGAITLPVIVYTFWIMQADPMLREWMAQNLTPSPPVWDYALGYGLILALAAPGVIEAVRRKNDADLMLLAWVGVTALLLYAPVSLQRRFSLGLHIPLAIWAALGTCRLAKRRLMTHLALAATLLTTLFLLVLATASGLMRDPRFFVSADEAAAMDWLQRNTPREAVVLASPEMGTFIPAWAGRRVVYGHPFETPQAEQTKARVERFFASGADLAEREAMWQQWREPWIFIGPRERALGLTGEAPGRQVFRNATVAIYGP